MLPWNKGYMLRPSSNVTARMKNQKPSSRHHYLSQFYLAGFTDTGDKDGTLHVTDLHNCKQWPDVTNNVGYKKHFNTLNLPGFAPDAVEKRLGGEFEGPVSNVVQEIIETQILPEEDQDRILLANLIGLFGIRLPQMREKVRDFEERIHLRIIEQLLSSREFYEAEMHRLNRAREEQGLDPLNVLEYDQMKLAFESAEWELEVPRERHFVREMELLDVILPYIIERTWTLSIAPENHQFICSDRPVSLVWTSPVPQVAYAPGFGIKNSELTFPLSKRLALIGTFEGEEQVTQVSQARVNEINGRTVHYAERFLYSGSRDFRFLDTDGTVRNVQDVIWRNN